MKLLQERIATFRLLPIVVVWIEEHCCHLNLYYSSVSYEHTN